MRNGDLGHAHRLPVEQAAASLEQAFGGDVAVVGAFAHCDTRGRLIELDPTRLPFLVRRVFTIGDVPAGTVRGRHRHRVGAQALFCTAGRVDVGLRRGTTPHGPVTLTPGGSGLCVAAGVWSEQRYVLDGSMLLVMASEPYDPDSYEHDG